MIEWISSCKCCHGNGTNCWLPWQRVGFFGRHENRQTHQGSKWYLERELQSPLSDMRLETFYPVGEYFGIGWLQELVDEYSKTGTRLTALIYGLIAGNNFIDQQLLHQVYLFELWKLEYQNHGLWMQRIKKECNLSRRKFIQDAGLHSKVLENKFLSKSLNHSVLFQERTKSGCSARLIRFTVLFFL